MGPIVLVLCFLFGVAHAKNGTASPPEPHLNCSAPFWSRDLAIATPLVFAGAFICSGGGIGGGGVFVPTFILGLGLSAHFALPLSQVTIAGVGLGSAVFLLPRRHPVLPRRLIDLNLAALLEPATLLGTIPGVYMNVMFPAYLITILLAVLLAATSATTLRKGWQQWKKEKQDERERKSGTPSSTNDSMVNNNNDDNDDDKKLLIHHNNIQSNSNIEVGTESQHDGIWTWQQMTGLLVSAVVLAASLTAKSFFPCTSWPYWVFVGATLPIIGAITWYFALQPPFRSRFKWIWSVAGFVAGLAAGFLGIGGGMVKSPLMIAMGTTPQVATATASFMILFTSAGTTLQFFLLGRLCWQSALWYGAAGMLGSFSGQFFLARMVKKYGKQSWISFFVGLIIIGCTIAIVVTNVLEMVAGNANMSFNGPCASA